MPDERTPNEQARDRLQDFRRTVSDAVAELRSNQIRDTYAALSIEELMDQHIVQLTDESNPIRLSHRQRIERVYTNLVNKIEAMKATDPASFRVRDPSTDVNTNPDGSDADPPGTHTGSTGSTP